MLPNPSATLSKWPRLSGTTTDWMIPPYVMTVTTMPLRLRNVYLSTAAPATAGLVGNGFGTFPKLDLAIERPPLPPWLPSCRLWADAAGAAITPTARTTGRHHLSARMSPPFARTRDPVGRRNC